jgi:hypothetical protein
MQTGHLLAGQVRTGTFRGASKDSESAADCSRADLASSSDLSPMRMKDCARAPLSNLPSAT